MTSGRQQRIVVLGAGAMGTALVSHLSRLGREVALWGTAFDAAALAGLRTDRRHPRFGFVIGDDVSLHSEDNLAAALRGAGMVTFAVISPAMRTIAEMVAPLWPAGAVAINVAKGLEQGTEKRMSEILQECLPPGTPVMGVAGPSLAVDVAEGRPTAVVFAGHPDATSRASAAFASPRYTVRVTEDLLGAELCEVIKNPVALAVGLVEGLGEKADGLKNARAAIFTEGVDEMAELVEVLGGRAETVWGLAGVGDALVTSLGGRNRAYGLRVAAGEPPAEALAAMVKEGLSVEGYDATARVKELVDRHHLKAPLLRALHAVIFEGAPAAHVLEVGLGGHAG